MLLNSVFRKYKDVLSKKTPRIPGTLRAALGANDGVYFLLVTSLFTKKEKRSSRISVGDFAEAVFEIALHRRFGFRSSAIYARRCRLQTQRATRMEARRFPTEPRIGESENPRSATDLRFALSGGRPFSLVTFFLAKKRK
jgi:hypothetical protein